MKFNPTGLTAPQLRAARQLVGWSAEVLAAKSGVGIATIRRAELCHDLTGMRPETAEKVVKALERAGVMFYGADRDGGPGVRLKR
jgi:transcriptional regulator with XRE-family HTH domain